jgi:hypothetical protein
MRKVAFCFLIYDTVHHELLWHEFFQKGSPSQYTIQIHTKEEKTLSFFEKYKIPSIKTEYGTISIVAAQTRLLEYALRDPEVQHMIFLSQSCIPLKSFETIYNYLNPEKSYFTHEKQQACFPRCDSVVLEKKYIQKQYQWCILNRKHAQLMVDHQEYMKWFETIFAPDEHCYLTNLFVHGLEGEIVLASSKTGTTFVNWEDETATRPKTYDSISNTNLERLCRSPFLFARKFSSKCTLRSSFYRGHILTHT